MAESITNKESRWVIGYFHCESADPHCLVGNEESPAFFTEKDARDEASRLNCEHINCLQEEAFDSFGKQVWSYAAMPATGPSSGIRFIPNRTLRRLNKIALKHGKNCLTDDCPVLRDGFATPIVLAVPNIDTTGWVRCLIPATPDCEKQVVLDIQFDEFNALPIHTSTGVTVGGEVETDRRS